MATNRKQSLRDENPTLIKVQFRMRAAHMFHKVMELEGRKVDTRLVTVADLQQAHEVEAFLERMFGYRFHILMGAKEVDDYANKGRVDLSRGLHERGRRRGRARS